jgi:hypothetical protein
MLYRLVPTRRSALMRTTYGTVSMQLGPSSSSAEWLLNPGESGHQWLIKVELA